VSENRVLRKIVVPKKVGMIGVCRKLNDGELHKFYSSLKLLG
jgi:hypothetical protein